VLFPVGSVLHDATAAVGREPSEEGLPSVPTVSRRVGAQAGTNPPRAIGASINGGNAVSVSEGSTGSASGDSNVSASGVSNVSASGASTASTTPPPLAPTTFTLTPPPEYRYEEQDRCLCAMHALNNLRAATWATVEMMQEAAGGRRDQNGRAQGPGSGYTMLTVEKVLAKRGVRTYERNVRNGNRERLVQGEQWAEVCGGRWGQGAIIHTACDLQQG
jgi:hypothetical protein